MTNFKSGSGNLDFGGDGEESADGEDAPESSSAAAQPSSTDAEPAPSDESAADESTAPARSEAAESAETYPYFVRRNNVGDERDTRLEIHVRDKVADREAQFRHALADRLGASDVSKTDAREFALLAAFEHPEKVAQLMREEGFDTLG